MLFQELPERWLSQSSAPRRRCICVCVRSPRYGLSVGIFESGSAGTRTRNQPRKLSGLLLFSQVVFLIQCQNRQLRILFAFELTFKGTRFTHRRELFRADENDFSTKTACGVITSAPMLGDAALEVLSGSDVIAPSTAYNVNPGHISDGSAGTRTRNQRLKRALLYRLSYRPMREAFLKYIAVNGNIVGQALRLPTMS